MAGTTDHLCTDALPSAPPEELPCDKAAGNELPRQADPEEDPSDDAQKLSGAQRTSPKPPTRTAPTKYKNKPRTKPKEAANIASMINISNSNGIHIGTSKVINISVNNKPKAANTAQCGASDPPVAVTKTEDIQLLLDNRELLQKPHLVLLSGHMGDGWRDVGRVLDFSEGQIDQFVADYQARGGIKEVIYQMLLDWIQNEPLSCSLGRLATVLWDHNQRDAVKRLAKHLYEKQC